MRPPAAANSKLLTASTPANVRIYAVGDIHGRADLLAGQSGMRSRFISAITSIAARIQRLSSICYR
jgi:hypothetical protein